MAKKKIWTDQEDEYIRAHWKSSPSVTEIASVLGVARSTVWHRACDVLNLPHRNLSRSRQIVSAQDPRIKDRCAAFLVKYEETERKTASCEAVRLLPRTLNVLMRSDEEFCRLVTALDRQIKATKKCSICNEVKLAAAFKWGKRTCFACLKQRRIDRKKTLPGRLAVLRESARSQDAACDFDVQYLPDLWEQQCGLCFYTGAPMKFTSDILRDPDLVSMDRMVPAKGYSRGNIALCRWVVNRTKHSLSPKQFVATCKLILEVHDENMR